MNEIDVTVKKTSSFLKKKHELSGLLADLEKASDKALEVLLNALVDEKVNLKLKADIAKTIIEFRTKIADQISKDNLNRQIAEIRINGVKTISLEDSKKTPILDFGTIREL